MKVNIAILWPNLARAYEIALAGNLPISLYYDKENYPQATEDFKIKIEPQLNEVEFSFNEGLQVQLCPPEDEAAVLKRLSFFKKQPPTIEGIIEKNKAFTYEVLSMSYMAKQLLDKATEKLYLSEGQLIWIGRIATTISQMGGHNVIDVSAMAEAIHYVCTLNEGLLPLMGREENDKLKEIINFCFNSLPDDRQHELELTLLSDNVLFDNIAKVFRLKRELGSKENVLRYFGLYNTNQVL